MFADERAADLEDSNALVRDPLADPSEGSLNRTSMRTSMRSSQRSMASNESGDESGLHRTPSMELDKKRSMYKKKEESFFSSFRKIAGMSLDGEGGDAVASAQEPFMKPSFSVRQASSLKMGLRHVSMTLFKTASDELAERDDASKRILSVHQKLQFKTSPAVVQSHRDYSFSIKNLHNSSRAFDRLSLGSFTDMSHLAFGSNAEVSLAKLCGDVVVIKLIKEDKANNSVAKFEFDMEHGVLGRLEHPHIMKLFGSGLVPRRFLVLEWLGGGTLTDRLSRKETRRSVLDMMFPRPKVALPEVYRIGIALADAFDYLHRRLHQNAIIIHRDLKPDNVGFTTDGTLKLFDFGLCVCVKRFTEACDSYNMSGNTGSLRYMAPEVALNKPYNEKVDVYSFFILLWQVATDRVPFKGANRKDYLRFVAKSGVRPDVPSHWPAGLRSLVIDGWDPDPRVRPSFQRVVSSLRTLSGSVDSFAEV